MEFIREFRNNLESCRLLKRRGQIAGRKSINNWGHLFVRVETKAKMEMGSICR